MHPFIGRTSELENLHKLFGKGTASLVVIHGRRGIGKSRLAQQFASSAPHYIFSGFSRAADQKKEIALQMEYDGESSSVTWEDLFFHLAQKALQGKIVLVLDEIGWIGANDPLFLKHFVLMWDLYFKNNPNLIFILCCPTCNWTNESILNNKELTERISLNILLEELPLHECSEFWGIDQYSTLDKLKVLSLTGGVPLYLEDLIPPSLDVEANIKKLFQKENFYSEFDRIFSDMPQSRTLVYKKIIERLAQESCDQKEIYATLGVQKGGAVSNYIKDLIRAGFISQDYAWNLKSNLHSKSSYYRLKDNYLRCYFKYILTTNAKNDLTTLEEIIPLQFKNLILNNRTFLHQLIGVIPSEIVNANPFFQNKTKNKSGCQIDYLIQTKFGICYLCEIKFSEKKITNQIINEVKQKVKNLFFPKNISIKPVLIHVNGVEQSVLDEGFFSAIISLEDFFLLNHKSNTRDGRLEFEKVLKYVPYIEQDFTSMITSYSSPIVSPNFNDPMKTSHGCGTFVEINGIFGILTAAHVAEIFIKRKDNLIYLPYEDELQPITYNQIILLPYIEGVLSIDIAFIALSDEKKILEFGKSFLPLETNCNITEKIDFLDLQCGYYAAPGFRKFVNYSKLKPVLNYEYSGVYFGNPDKESYAKKSFYFPIYFPKHIQNQEIQFDSFLVHFEKWKNIPDKFSGTSGSGFWGSEQIYDKDNQLRFSTPKLLGVMVEENKMLRKLGVRGPISLYKTFLKYCIKALETGDCDLALNEIFVTDHSSKK